MFLKQVLAAQDQLSAANEAVEKRNIASARNRLDQYLPAAADAREQAARANLSTKIISDEAFKDAVNLAQESIQGLEGNQRFKYGIASTPQGEGADSMRRQKAETAMKNLYTQYTDQELRDMLGPEKFEHFVKSKNYKKNYSFYRNNYKRIRLFKITYSRTRSNAKNSRCRWCC